MTTPNEYDAKRCNQNVLLSQKYQTLFPGNEKLPKMNHPIKMHDGTQELTQNVLTSPATFCSSVRIPFFFFA
jgi:hypothetical protein